MAVTGVGVGSTGEGGGALAIAPEAAEEGAEAVAAACRADVSASAPVLSVAVVAGWGASSGKGLTSELIASGVDSTGATDCFCSKSAFFAGCGTAFRGAVFCTGIGLAGTGAACGGSGGVMLRVTKALLAGSFGSGPNRLGDPLSSSAWAPSTKTTSNASARHEGVALGAL